MKNTLEGLDLFINRNKTMKNIILAVLILTSVNYLGQDITIKSKKIAGYSIGNTYWLRCGFHSSNDSIFIDTSVYSNAPLLIQDYLSINFIDGSKILIKNMNTQLAPSKESFQSYYITNEQSELLKSKIVYFLEFESKEDIIEINLIHRNNRRNRCWSFFRENLNKLNQKIYV